MRLSVKIAVDALSPEFTIEEALLIWRARAIQAEAALREIRALAVAR